MNSSNVQQTDTSTKETPVEETELQLTQQESDKSVEDMSPESDKSVEDISPEYEAETPLAAPALAQIIKEKVQTPPPPSPGFTGVIDAEDGVRQYFSEGRLLATIHQDLLAALNHANLPHFLRGPWGIFRTKKPS